TTTTLACSSPAQTGTIGTGTFASITYSPHYLSTSAYSNRKQFIFLKSELDAMGFVGGGRINSIALDYTTANSQVTGIVIKMGCTSLVEYIDNDWIQGMTTVKNSFNYTPSVGWNTFALDNPYLWDGLSNLIVEFCVDDLQTGTGSSVRYGNVGFYGCNYRNLFNVAGVCSELTGIRTLQRPNMQFTFCQATPAGYTYSWSPTTGLSNTGISNPISTINTNTTYTVIVSDGSSCMGNGSIDLYIDSTNYVIASPDPDTTVCPGDLVQLNATVFGPQQPYPLSCGINNTPCTQTIQTTQVGTGTYSSALFGPFPGSNADAKFQYIYTATELNTMGITAGTIRELEWNVLTQSSTNAYSSFTISMGCTNESSFILSAGWLPTTTVRTATNHTTSVGWNNFVLTNPFDWDGISNLVVGVCYNNNNNGGSANDNVQYVWGVGFNCTMRAYNNVNGTNGCTMNPVTVTTSRPNLRFIVCPPAPIPYTYSWTPAGGVSNSSIANPTANPTVQTTYTVTVTGGKCTVNDETTVYMCNVLPIELLEFTGFAEEKENILKWTTSSEINNAYFIIEKTINGTDFNDIGRVKGNGNSSILLSYSFNDHTPTDGNNYYRLKQVDFDGSFKNSELILIRRESKNTYLVHLYPNPFNDIITLEIQASVQENIRIELYDKLGSLVKTIPSTLAPGHNVLNTNIAELSAGVYSLVIKYNSSSNSEVKRIVKLK
ncbi:MAG: T9SS type A sorting domain-containing protein, partial [Bacteroidetes bacterium]|nr:T9SS type A sorting domain-containing protein [Bacteroidota bacterium]